MERDTVIIYFLLFFSFSQANNSSHLFNETTHPSLYFSIHDYFVCWSVTVVFFFTFVLFCQGRRLLAKDDGFWCENKRGVFAWLSNCNKGTWSAVLYRTRIANVDVKIDTTDTIFHKSDNRISLWPYGAQEKHNFPTYCNKSVDS